MLLVESPLGSAIPSSETGERADRFVALLAAERPVIVPSAWDAGSASLLRDAGARAIAVNLNDVAWSLGHTGWASASDDVVAACSRICRSARVPIIVELDTPPINNRLAASYGVASLVRALIGCGIAGVTVAADATIEGRVRWIRSLRSLSDRPFIEARVDPPVAQACGRREQYDAMLRFAQACVDAGADGVLVSARQVVDVSRLVRGVSVPVSVDVGDGWAPPVQMFQRVGVRSVRLGRGALRAALGMVRSVVREALERGSYDLMNRHLLEDNRNA
jgi:2-methylisocitrate lyase-like PEP mutase family enzyme